MCQTICREQSRWVPTFLTSWSGAPLGPVVSTPGILPQVEARVQSQCHLSTSLLSAVRVWVCELRQADYQGICAPTTLQFSSAENRGVLGTDGHNTTCMQSCTSVCNNFSRQQFCVCRASRLQITTVIHLNALKIGYHWGSSFSHLLQDAAESQASMPHLCELRNRGDNIALIGAGDASCFSKRLRDPVA